jgi:hypothetical protein
LAAFPRPPAKIVPFHSGPLSPVNLERQFDEHTRSLKSVIEFLRFLAREDGVLRNGKVGLEQLDPAFFKTLSERLSGEVEELLFQVKTQVNYAARIASEVRVVRDEMALREKQIASSAMSMAQTLEEVRERLKMTQETSPSSTAMTALPTGALGPGAGGFYGVDTLGASATAQDWAQVSIEWAEHLPDPIPPNILAQSAITGQHWSSRWWASKSANAFGMLAWWYQGAFPSPGPPTTPLTPTGDPIPVGGMYYNTTLGVMMVWNGSTWVNSATPQKGVTASLYYLAAANQTVFPLSVIDRNGKNFAFNQTAPEGLQALVNGVRVEPTFDYTVDTVGSSVTFLRALPVNTLVIFDILTPAAQLTPSGTVNTVLLSPITPDGTTTAFTGLQVAMNGHATNIAKNEELLVSVDGVQQAPGTAYTATGSTITFTEAPLATAAIFLIWFGPANP